MKTINALVAIMFTVALGATSLSCNVNDYCLNCATDGDGGMGSGDGDANDGGNDDAMPDASCEVQGPEQCNGEDDDCNGLVDDGVLPQVGSLCDVQLGVCAGGTKVCDQGELKCDKAASPEICDGLDNNCNGTVDEGDPGGGGKCGTDLGECVAGTLRCQAFSGCDPSPTCTTNCCVQCDGFIDTRNSPEACNGRDDDCDSMLDEGLTNLGACTWPGATDVGECNIGTLRCEGGAPVCPRAPMTPPPLGAVFPAFEQCNGLDDDCDTEIDEIFNKQTDPNNCMNCGTVCPTPSKTCINATNNGANCMMDSDCMGSGNPAPACVVNSQRRCTAGACGFQCNVGFINDDGQAGNGCEYKCSPTGTEECDGADNDCDGNIDENLNMNPPPGLCRAGGECGTTAPDAMCTGAGGWVCMYPGDVEFPEVSCDNKNNDCDANIDEAPLHAQKGQSCAETVETACSGAVDDDFDGRVNDGCPAVNAAETGNQCTDSVDSDGDGTVNDGCPAVAGNGQCRAEGQLQCNANAPTGALVCSTTVAGMPASAESCDAKDNDCDGGVDEGTLLGQDWVDVGGGKEMMKYEASKPDALANDQGNITNGKVCSRAGVQPWTNISYPQALAACQSIGATLCSEQTWHRTCSDVTPTFPATVNTAGTLIEAEEYTIISHATGGTPSATRSWVPDYSPGFSSISGLEATPNSPSGSVTAGNAPTQAPRLAYTLNFPTTSTTYRLYLKMFTTNNNAAADTVHVAIANSTAAVTPTQTVSLPAPTACSSNANCSSLPGTTCTDTNANGTPDTCTGWVWVDAGVNFNVSTAGNWTVNVYMGDDGAKIDQLYIRTGTGTPPQTINPKGNTWAYGNTYNATTCNGDDFDTNGVLAGDQDDIVATGSRTSCVADVGTGVFDLSGNVKEWTLAHQPGENPIRGGASNNTDVGISCPLNFTLADDSFFFPNIGFRCCRPTP